MEDIDNKLIEAYIKGLSEYPEMMDRETFRRWTGTMGRDAANKWMSMPDFPGTQVGSKTYVSKVALIDYLLRMGRRGQFVVM